MVNKTFSSLMCIIFVRIRIHSHLVSCRIELLKIYFIHNLLNQSPFKTCF